MAEWSTPVETASWHEMHSSKPTSSARIARTMTLSLNEDQNVSKVCV